MKKPRHTQQILITAFATIAIWQIGLYIFEQWQNAGHRQFAERLSGLDLSEAKFVNKKSQWSIGGPGGFSAYVFQLPSLDDAAFANMCRQMAGHAITLGAQITASEYGIASEFAPKPPVCGLSKTLPSAGVQRIILGRSGALYAETAE